LIVDRLRGRGKQMIEYDLEVFRPGQAVSTTCLHHWVIEPHTGPSSMGVCKYCGVESKFVNYLPRYAKTHDTARPCELSDQSLDSTDGGRDSATLSPIAPMGKEVIQSDEQRD
jgi:hypothetical protein